MIQPLELYDRTRYQCKFCLLNFFALKHYNPRNAEIFQEIVQSIEKECADCSSRIRIDSFTGELICKNCGLVFDGPVFTA